MGGFMTSATTDIRLLILDVDGVLTTGHVALDYEGREIKTFHARDGFGIQAWMRTGHEVALITGRAGTALAARARELGVRHVYQGCKDKRDALQDVLGRCGISSSRAAAIGDDLPDLHILNGVGYPMAVRDAVAEVRQAARFVTSAPGGQGAVREAIEHLMGPRWQQVVSGYVSNQEITENVVPDGTP
ncbi:MAG: HAD-IIIA family hydrolase [Planctomycetes bacterium]|nr:HAD-IIIA family hydrolase [Planctomycetota bacterium]